MSSSENELRAELHRLVDALDAVKLSAAVDKLRSEHAREVVSGDEALAALHELNGGPIPEHELRRARESFRAYPRAS